MTAFTFEVAGKPEPQRRPRAFARGGHARVHNDPRNETYADRIRWAWRAAGGRCFGEAPVIVWVIAEFPRPKGHWRTNGELSAAGHRSPHFMGTPDGDNIAKGVCDALNGLAWVDDRQVISLTVEKHWVVDQGLPGCVRVQIKPVEVAG